MSDRSDKRTSLIAVASLLCAIGAIGSELLMGMGYAGDLVIYSVNFSYIAIILGIVATVMIIIRRKVLKGYTYAIVAIILVTPILVFDYGVKRSVEARQQRKKEWTGLYNLELLGNELIRYAKDNNDCLPVAEKWCDLLMEHNKALTKENFRHPQPEIFKGMFNFKGECQFAFNKSLSGKKLADIPPDVVLIFEADGPWNMAGGPELLATRYREKGYLTVLFADLTTADYWYENNAVRKFDKKGTSMHYVEPRWLP